MGEAQIPICAYCFQPGNVGQFTIGFNRYEYLHAWHAGPYRLAHPPANLPTTLILPPPKIVNGPTISRQKT
jgi:hypothetical protein